MWQQRYRCSIILAIPLGLALLGCVDDRQQSKAERSAGKGLVGCWRFDEGQGSIAKDSSGRGNDGELHNTEWVTGPFGTALHFGGEDAYVSIPRTEGLKGSDEMTVEAWVFWEGTGRYPNVLTAEPWNPGGFMIFVGDDRCSFRMGRPAEEAWELRKGWQEVGATFLKPLPLGRWVHLTATFKRPTLTTYVDGKPVGSANWNYPVGHCGKLHIGRWGEGDLGTTMCHHGMIDEVKIYSRALTGEEIEAEYDRECARRK